MSASSLAHHAGDLADPRTQQELQSERIRSHFVEAGPSRATKRSGLFLGQDARTGLLLGAHRDADDRIGAMYPSATAQLSNFRTRLSVRLAWIGAPRSLIPSSRCTMSSLVTRSARDVAEDRVDVDIELALVLGPGPLLRLGVARNEGFTQRPQRKDAATGGALIERVLTVQDRGPQPHRLIAGAGERQGRVGAQWYFCQRRSSVA